MTADPSRRLSSIDLLIGVSKPGCTDGEPSGVDPATRPASIPVLFGAQVPRTPEAVAISYGERSWTYRESG